MELPQSSQTPQRPFWVKQPWVILFDPTRLGSIRPWDIDLSFLLTSFLSEMKKFGFINFSITGIALLSSTSIYRMKSELVLKLEEPPQPPQEKPAYQGPIAALHLPFRYEYASLTMEDLITAIRDILVGIPGEAQARTVIQPIPETLTPFPLPTLDPFMVQIEEQIQLLHTKLVDLLTTESLVPYSKVVAGMERRVAIQTFIALLFLASQKKISLWQEEGVEEIYISMPAEVVT